MRAESLISRACCARSVAFLVFFCLASGLIASPANARISAAKAAESSRWYVCEPDSPERTLSAAFRKLGREITAIRIKDDTGYYNRMQKPGAFDPGVALDHEQRKLWGASYDPDTGGLGKLTIELIIVEDWQKEVACAIWLYPTSNGPIVEFRLTANDPRSIRNALGVRTGGRGKLARLGPRQPERPDNLLAYLSANIFPLDLDLQNVDRILIRPGGLTAELPFSALRTSQGYVGGTLAVVMLPAGADLNTVVLPRSARYTNLAEARRNSDEFYVNPLVIGNPVTSWDRAVSWQKIDATEQEANKVAEKFHTHAILSAQASKEIVLGRMRKADYIHLASHAISDMTNPMTQSFVVLSGGYLTARDIQRAPTLEGKPVVVLSACQTGLGKPFEGGAYGLARAFLVKGATAVVGNLWNVDDSVSGQMMAEFGGKVANGQAPEFALRDTLRQAIGDNPDTPAYWGSYVLYGYPTEGEQAFPSLPHSLWPWAY
jgi:hypothetical protein